MDGRREGGKGGKKGKRKGRDGERGEEERRGREEITNTIGKVSHRSLMEGYYMYL